MLHDSSDSSSSQLTYQKIFKRYPTCFPEQHHEGYGKFIQASEKEIKLYKGLYGRKVAPLIFFADEMMNRGDLVLSGKDVDLQFLYLRPGTIQREGEKELLRSMVQFIVYLPKFLSV